MTPFTAIFHYLRFFALFYRSHHPPLTYYLLIVEQHDRNMYKNFDMQPVQTPELDLKPLFWLSSNLPCQ